MRILVVLNIFIFFVSFHLSAQKILYSSDAYTLNQNAVYEDKYEAGAVSAYEIKSNYESSFRKGTSRVVGFKFSINGDDNERPPSQDHFVLLEPDEGYYETPVFVFGEEFPEEVDWPDADEAYFKSSEKIKVLFRLDMRNVFHDFETQGFYQAYDGSIINRKNFTGVYIAGSEPPLSWNFDQLSENNNFRLTDADNDSIFEISITFDANPDRPINSEGYSEWKLSKDISRYPQFSSSHTITNALYNLSLEELIQNIRPDSAFMAGAKWPGVWTRDISYSILLALAITNPDISKNSLLAKVKDERIIQDTGTGGSWPISSDRMSWALAAWEIYIVTGDKDWLQKSYTILKNSTSADRNTLIDPYTNLFYGESSFLDWREQSYPPWMDPKDIFTSLNLSTNAVHFRTYQILAKMAKILDEPYKEYSEIAQSIKQAINTHFWMAEKGYYGQYLYGRNYKALSTRSEALGEAFSILFDIAEKAQKNKITKNTPLLDFGIPCIFPQTTNIPPYHNNGIWPFVQSFWTWAAAKAENEKAVAHGLSSIYRAAALFLSNKENLVASTGNFNGTEINSDRQLWSVAGNLATYFRVIFGMNFQPDSLLFNPFIPESFRGTYRLQNFKYRNSILDISVSGFGNKIDSVYFDNQSISNAIFSGDLEGSHDIRLILNNKLPPSRITIVNNHFTNIIKGFELDDNELSWDSIDGDPVYLLYKNGKPQSVVKDTEFEIPEKDYPSEYQVLAVDDKGYASFLSEPLWFSGNKKPKVFQPDKFRNKIHVAYEGYTGIGYIPLTTTQNTSVSFSIHIIKSGYYSIDFRYANGNGPINTDNKCAVRTLSVDKNKIGIVVFPQRGVHLWTEWGYSNSIKIFLSRGEHLINVDYLDFNKNMNEKENVAFLDHIRLKILHFE